MGQIWEFAGWFYKRDGQSFGPLSTDQVQQLLTTGVLQPVDRLWKKWTRPAECQLTLANAQTALEGEPTSG